MGANKIDDARKLQAAGKFLAAADTYAKVMGGAPEFAQVLTLITADALAKNDKAATAVLVRRAVAVEAAASDVMMQLAALLERHREFDHAALVNRRRVELAPGAARPWRDLGAALHKAGRFEEAEAATLHALDLNDGDDVAHGNLGAIRRDRGDIEGAMASVRRALAIDGKSARHLVLKAEILLATGELEDGFAAYENRLKIPELFAPARRLGIPRWDGSAVDGALLIVAEQGFGDTLQFCRYAKIASRLAKRTVLVVHPPLLPLLRSLVGVEVYSFEAPVQGPFAAAASLMSLPHLLSTGSGSVPVLIPYLAPSRDAEKTWKGRVSTGGFRVGLFWRGNAEGAHDRGRSMTLDDLRPLAAMSGVAFHSLQTETTKKELAAWPGQPLVDLGGKFRSFDDTAAAIASLDLVVTTDTAVAHVAGAIGSPCWLMLKQVPAWRWGLEGKTTPWYPSLRLIRQSEDGDWAGVVETVAAGLNAFRARA